jgi:hypothetical protein
LAVVIVDPSHVSCADPSHFSFPQTIVPVGEYRFFTAFTGSRETLAAKSSSV